VFAEQVVLIDIGPDGQSLDLLQANLSQRQSAAIYKKERGCSGTPVRVPQARRHCICAGRWTFAMQLEQRLKRRQEMKLIEAKPIAKV
jgi:hypothetical protein